MRRFFEGLPYIRTAVLFGSRAQDSPGAAREKSDYDFAVAFAPGFHDDWGLLARARIDIGERLGLDDVDFDIVDLEQAAPPLLKSIRSRFVILKGEPDEFRILSGGDGQGADAEKEVLDLLSEMLRNSGELDKIQQRAAQASLQILIENAIGKARRILKHFNCPVVPTRSRDGILILHDAGLISDETYGALMSAVGFRNAMIHDYMNFDPQILLGIVRERKYLDIYHFLVEVPAYSEVLRKRLENYAP